MRNVMYFDKESLSKRGLIWKGSLLPYNPQLVEKARMLRKDMTPEEKRLYKGDGDKKYIYQGDEKIIF